MTGTRTRTEETGKLLILEEELEKVLAAPFTPSTLFGKRGYVTLPSGVYDFVFHSIGNIPHLDFSQEAFIVIPVLPYRDGRETPLEIYQAHLQSAGVNTFAIRTREPKTIASRTGKRDAPGGLALDFYDVSRSEEGLGITKKGDYLVADEAKFRRNFASWDEIASKVSSWRDELNARYSA